MKVKIGDKIYDSNEQPIMLIMEEYNVEDISDLLDDDELDEFIYCDYPDHMSEEEAMKFMGLELDD